jgi:sugar lactone lactonase YvrE
VDPAGSVSTLAPRLHLSKPSGVAIGFGGQVLIADTGNNRIVAVAPDGTVSIVAGSGEEGYAGDGGPALTADLSHPTCLAVDANDDLFVADVGNDRVRRISVDRTITTAAGTGDQGFSGDGGPADEATLRLANGPLSSGGCLAVDGAGDLFIADALNNRIREVTVAGVIRTVAGNGRSGFSGDGGAATGAELSVPLGVASDLAGHLYIADSDTNRVRRVS